MILDKNPGCVGTIINANHSLRRFWNDHWEKNGHGSCSLKYQGIEFSPWGLKLLSEVEGMGEILLRGCINHMSTGSFRCLAERF